MMHVTEYCYLIDHKAEENTNDLEEQLSKEEKNRKMK